MKDDEISVAKDAESRYDDKAPEDDEIERVEEFSPREGNVDDLDDLEDIEVEADDGEEDRFLDYQDNEADR